METHGALYFSNGGLGPLVAEVISIEGNKVKIGYWNSESKAASPRVKTVELSKSRFFSETCGWQLRPERLLELERDEGTKKLIAKVIAGRIPKREVHQLLGCNPQWANYLCRTLSRQMAHN